MIEINRRAYRAHELNEKYEIKKTEKKTFLEEERISETLTVRGRSWVGLRPGTVRLYVKMPENHFKILEVGKNVRK